MVENVLGGVAVCEHGRGFPLGDAWATSQPGYDVLLKPLVPSYRQIPTTETTRLRFHRKHESSRIGSADSSLRERGMKPPRALIVKPNIGVKLMEQTTCVQSSRNRVVFTRA
jgi:hypothetical protein